MSDRRENSVLFSLKELRRIEDDRVRREQDELTARLEAERAAKEAAERAKAEAEYKTQLAAIQKEMDNKLAHASSDAERARIREEASRQALAARSKHSVTTGGRSSSGESSSGQNKIKAPGKHEISDNPLE